MTHEGVHLQFLVADYEPPAADRPQARLLEGWRHKTRETLLDGPVSPRVAVVDIDPDTGLLVPGAPYRQPARRQKFGRYAIKDATDFDAPDFQQVSVFSAVLKTMSMFEEPDVLGRPLRWAFDGAQLLVVPRAGRMANAFYHRDSRSLQFFFFDAWTPVGERTIYTCLSPDIIAHETTHAILDGIAPDLFDATSPQALALHEAIADLAAVVFALRTDDLRNRVLEASGGDLSKSKAFNAIAEQFGTALHGVDRPLRDLYNCASLSPRWGQPVNRNAPHDLSTVLSGALYRLLVRDHEETKRKLVDALVPPPADREAALYSASGKALFLAGEKFKRMVFRALDYLPPGEISFADYGRALIAADAAANPEPSWERDFVKEEFARRGIVSSPSDLDPKASGIALPPDLDIELLLRSDDAAMGLAETLRDGLLVPKDVVIELRPRLDVTKTTYRHGRKGASAARELILKVAWREKQVVTRLGGLVDQIEMTFGTTLAVDWETRAVRAMLTTARSAASGPSEIRAEAEAREAYVLQCVEEGAIELGGESARITGRTLRLRGTAQRLHVCGC